MSNIYKTGEKVGKYEIVKLIRDGNFAAAYEAKEGIKRIFLKVYSDPTSYHPEFQQFIKQQKYMAEILNKLIYTEKVYELFEIDGGTFHCQAKEFMNGMDLDTYLNYAPSFDKRVEIVKNLIIGLNEIHTAGIVYCCFSLDDIFMFQEKKNSENLSPKFTDFDFSRIPNKFEPVYKVVKPFFSSSEYLKNEEITFESDVFTIGIIIYKVLTGQEPYPVGDQDEYAKAVFEYKVKPPHEHNPLIDLKTSELILMMLNPDKNNRPSLVEVYNSL